MTSIGRIVHYVVSEADLAKFPASTNIRAGTVLPAIIVCVFSEDCVNLKVFGDHDNDIWVTSRSQTLDEVPPHGKWFWPRLVT